MTAQSSAQQAANVQSGGAIVPGFNAETYGGNDDGSAPCTGTDAGTPSGCTPSPVSLPFVVNFYGTRYDSVYLNNNGNLTFGAPLSQYTPESLNQISVPMIAPFWSDVDTRAGSTVTYGDGTVDGHIAFGVNWFNSGCFSENNSVADTFQVLLIQRPDLGTDDWNIEFNYGPLTWDSGQASGGDGSCLNGTAARAGYTSGSGVSCEFEGSGENGALLSDDPETGLSNHSFNSTVTGRYLDQVAGADGTPNGCGLYWALGDSYSSGEGTGLYNLAGEKCNRSTLGWPMALFAKYPAVPPISAGTYVACSGDTTRQILTGQPTFEPVSQVDRLRSAFAANGEPGLVTATGGGNDDQVDFSGILGSCVASGVSDIFALDEDSIDNGQQCIAMVKAETSELESGAFTAILKNYYTQIVLAAEGKAKDATPPSGDPNVVIVGYPNLFPAPTQANAVTAEKECLWMGSSGLNILQAFADGQKELNSVMTTAARQAGVRFVNLGDPLVGHELCTADPDMMGLNVFNNRHAGHPTAAGQQLMADKVASMLGYLAGRGGADSEVSPNAARTPAAGAAGPTKRPGTGKHAAVGANGSAGATGRTAAPQRTAVVETPAVAPSVVADLPHSGVGLPYYGYLGATGGTGPYTFSITGGNLPAGLTIDPTGVLIGTPTSAGTATFTVTATDASSPPQTAAASETIDVLADPVLAIGTSTLPGPTVGQEYDVTVPASGGMPDLTWSVTSGNLPAGLSLQAATGEISGQPTAAGSSTFTVRVTDGSIPTAQSVTQTFTMTVAASSATLATVATTLPGASMGDGYRQTLRSTGGNGPVSWSVASGSLPPGFGLDPATGEITGVATEAGSFAFTAQVQVGTQTATESLSITIADGTPLSIDSISLPDGTQGAAYDQALIAKGGVAPYAWTVSAGGLPAGVGLDPATGEITGTPTTSGSFAFTVAASDSAATAQNATENLTLSVATAPPPPAMTLADTVTDGTVGTAYQAALIPANGAGPYTYAVTGGALPGGLTLDQNLGIISGTPTAAGTFTATLTASDSSTPTARTATDSVSIAVAAPGPLAVAAPSLPNGTLGSLYATQVAVSGGIGADTFAVTSGSLPAGLALDPVTGIISGTPTTAGASTFTVTVTDSDTPTADTAGAGFTITVGSATPVSVTTTSLTAAQQDTPYSQILTATGGAAPYTWSVGSGSLPAGLSLDSGSGVISGTPSGSGTSTFTVKATDSLTPTAQSATAQLTLTVNPGAQLGITTTELPDATRGSAYTATVDAGGGTPPYTWSVGSGSLPAGLTLNPATGEISGTPTGSGPSTFTVGVTDSSSGPEQAVSQPYTVMVAVGALIPQAISFTAPSSGVVGNTATLTATGGGSGNPVVFTVDGTSGAGVCTISGTDGMTVHYTGSGSCVIDADQAGNSVYADAPRVTRTIAVTNATGPSIDRQATVTGTTSAIAHLTTATTGDLIVAFVAGDGPASATQKAKVTGGGLTWTLARRTNTRYGTAEIWTARATGTLSNAAITSTLTTSGYGVDLTVVAFANAPGIGQSVSASANKGAPSASLSTTTAGSWVFAVGNDWTASTPRTVGAGQTLLTQSTDTRGDTYWVQYRTAPTPTAGTVVTINDTAPATDRWNLTLIEID